MKAIVSDGYGGPDILELREIEAPTVGADRVRIRVHAASANPADWHLLRGEPSIIRLIGGLRQPKGRVPGIDAAGQVEQVGPKVTQFRPGDDVFGGCKGAFAEYASAAESEIAPKPAWLTFEQAAAIPIAGCTALQALRDHGRLKPGQTVLVNGAAGGVGTFAVQIAKALGGEVTAVCSTRNIDLVQSLGADHVVDYTVEDFTRGGQRYDLIVQIAGNQSFRDLGRALTARGTLVLIGGGIGREGSGRSLTPLAHLTQAVLVSRLTKQRVRMFIAKIRRHDLLALVEFAEAGKLTPIVERTYPLSQAPDALAELETGHTRGKIVITI